MKEGYSDKMIIMFWIFWVKIIPPILCTGINIKTDRYNIQTNVRMIHFDHYREQIHAQSEIQCTFVCSGHRLCCLSSFDHGTGKCYLFNFLGSIRCDSRTEEANGVMIFVKEVKGQVRGGRRSVSHLMPMNGGSRPGNFAPEEFCPPATFATGFNIKVEAKIVGENSALNAIELICSDGVKITSGEGRYGEWKSSVNCGSSLGKPSYLVAFKLQVEPEQGIADDTAANWISFKCRPFDIDNSYQLDIAPGHFHWGTYGEWSSSCPVYYAICGLKTRVDDRSTGDNIGLDHVWFYCCNK